MSLPLYLLWEGAVVVPSLSNLDLGRGGWPNRLARGCAGLAGIFVLAGGGA